MEYISVRWVKGIEFPSKFIHHQNSPVLSLRKKKAILVTEDSLSGNPKCRLSGKNLLELVWWFCLTLLLNILVKKLEILIESFASSDHLF